MSSNLSIEELRSKSSQANELIEKLKNQIEQIKIASSPAKMAERSTSLQKENEELKKKVEDLKKQLEATESKNPLANVSNISTTAQPTATPPATPQAEEKKEKKQKQPQQPQQESKKQGKKSKKEEEWKPEDCDISKLDIRIGKITEVKQHPDADSLYVEQIDLGEGKTRTVCSGLVKHIPLEEMQNQLVVCVCNLKPAKLRGILSEAMVLCASTPEKVELMMGPAGAQIGDKVTVEGFGGEPVAECTRDNKIFDHVAVGLKTNDDLIGCYNGKPMEVKGKGPLKSKTLKSVMVK